METATPPPGPNSRQLTPGFNVFGYLTATLGLSVVARNTVDTLLARDIPVRLADVDPRGGMMGADPTLAAEIQRTRDAGPYSVNVFHVNPDQIPYLMLPWSDRVRVEGVLQSCVPFWELPRLPRMWLPILAAMDAILAPSAFVADAVRADLPDARVLHYPQAVRVPDDIRPDRAAFGLPDDATVFVMSFDMRSDMERKNPGGAIEAFMRAFPERRDVRLVIKANNVGTVAGFGWHLERLRSAASDDRVTVMDRSMSYREILALYASCDALVSLHRAEGLGLALLEAMALGRPAIGTAWSGNMDFMTPDNSCPVPYRMIPVAATTQPAYGRAMSGAQEWADPDIDAAAAWMRRLADEEDLRASIGETARRDAERIRAEYDRGEVFDRLLEMRPLDPGHRAFRRLKASSALRYGRRLATSARRRAKMALTGRL